jgi:hypothetical protein
MLLRVLLIRTMSTTLWRTYVLVLTHLLPGICRLSLMLRLPVYLLVLLGLLPGLVLLLAVALDPLVRLVSLLRLRQLLLPPDRRGGSLTVILFLRIPYRRIMLYQGSDTLPRVVFDRAILSPLRWRIHYS